jgi:hypothetical protein
MWSFVLYNLLWVLGKVVNTTSVRWAWHVRLTDQKNLIWNSKPKKSLGNLGSNGSVKHCVPLKRAPNNNHVLRNQTEIWSRSTSCNRFSQPPPSYSRQDQPDCLAAGHASCAIAVQIRTWCVYEHYVCSFTNITSHQIVWRYSWSI